MMISALESVSKPSSCHGIARHPLAPAALAIIHTRVRCASPRIERAYALMAAAVTMTLAIFCARSPMYATRARSARVLVIHCGGRRGSCVYRAVVSNRCHAWLTDHVKSSVPAAQSCHSGIRVPPFTAALQAAVSIGNMSSCVVGWWAALITNDILPTKAASAYFAHCRMLSPPAENGKTACGHAVTNSGAMRSSGMSPSSSESSTFRNPVIAATVALICRSWYSAAGITTSLVKPRSRCTSRALQLNRSKCIAVCARILDRLWVWAYLLCTYLRIACKRDPCCRTSLSAASVLYALGPCGIAERS